MTADDAVLARIEERLAGIRGDVSELTAEMNRTRGRLHKLEGLSTLFMETMKENRRKEEAQYRRLGLRIQWAAIVLSLAAIIVPVVIVLLTRR